MNDLPDEKAVMHQHLYQWLPCMSDTESSDKLTDSLSSCDDKRSRI